MQETIPIWHGLRTRKNDFLSFVHRGVGGVANARTTNCEIMAGDLWGEGGWVLEEETSRKMRQNEIIKKLRGGLAYTVAQLTSIEHFKLLTVKSKTHCELSWEASIQDGTNEGSRAWTHVGGNHYIQVYYLLRPWVGRRPMIRQEAVSGMGPEKGCLSRVVLKKC
jgi:hypothetical protein